MRLVAVWYLLISFTLFACSPEQEPNNSEPEWLFVHTADSAQVLNKTTVLMPLSRDIFAFTDRPNRKHMYLNGEQFVSLWSEDSANSFKSDPPNAVLTWVEGDEIREVEVIITHAKFDSNQITYIIKDIEVESIDLINVSLFIDPYKLIANKMSSYYYSNEK